MRGPCAAFLGVAVVLGGCSEVLGLEPLSGSDASAVGDATTAPGADAPGESAGLTDSGRPTEAGGCVITWVDATAGAVPNGAFASTVPGSIVVLYVCRVATATYGVVPGKLRPGYGCYYGEVGQPEALSLDYEVLVPSNCTLTWVMAPGGVTPVGGIVSGESLDGGQLLSCQVEDGGADPGEIGHEGWSTSHECVYSLSGASLTTASDFDILAAQ